MNKYYKEKISKKDFFEKASLYIRGYQAGKPLQTPEKRISCGKCIEENWQINKGNLWEKILTDLKNQIFVAI